MDVIFFLVGGGVVLYYFDSIVIGVFGVMKKGIFVVCLVGNLGLDFIMVVNVVFWIIIVGVFIFDCDFFVNVVFDNGDIIKGVFFYFGKGFGIILYFFIYV